jgi:indole-3-glycerol phosphate synthase
VSILGGIIERKRREVGLRRSELPEDVLERRIEEMSPPRSLFAALCDGGGDSRIIAEIKRASPSRGNLNTGIDPAALAGVYREAGAAGVSVLTDTAGFGGTFEDLAAVRSCVDIPVLCKDFFLDRYQLLEARYHGADVILLIVAALDEKELRFLHAQAAALQLEVLVEVHDEDELARAAALPGCRLIGINNRNLDTFAVDLAVSERLAPLVPAGVRVVAESGVQTPRDVRRLRETGLVNFLVGEALVTAPDPGELLKQLLEAPLCASE